PAVGEGDTHGAREAVVVGDLGQRVARQARVVSHGERDLRRRLERRDALGGVGLEELVVEELLFAAARLRAGDLRQLGEAGDVARGARAGAGREDRGRGRVDALEVERAGGRAIDAHDAVGQARPAGGDLDVV